LSRGSRERGATAAVDAVLAALGVAVLGWPILATAVSSLLGSEGRPTGGGLIDPSAFGEEAGLLAGPAWQTLRVTGTAVLGALGIGVPLGVGLFRTDVLGRRPLIAAVAGALFVPMPVWAAGWLGGLGNAGYSQLIGDEPILTGWFGAAFVHAMAGVPWVVLLAGVGAMRVEPELEEVALLDLPAWRVVLGPTLRRALGAILGAALLVAVLTAGDMTVTDFLIVRTYAEEAYVQFSLGRSTASVAWVALPPTLVLGLLLWVGGRAVGRRGGAGVASASARPRRWRLGAWRGPVSGLAWALAIGVFGPPVLTMVWRAGRVGGSAAAGRPPSWSFGGLTETLGRAASELSRPLAETGLCAAAAALITVALAWVLAWRALESPIWRRLVGVTIALLLALPGPVAGMALILAYNRLPPIYDTAGIVILGYVHRMIPYALLVLWPALAGLPWSFLESSELDGLSRWGRAFRVALPLTALALGAAWGVVFVLALGELPVTNLVASAGLEPLPVFVWQQMHFGVDSRIAGIGLVMLGLYGALGGLTVAALGFAFGVRRPVGSEPPRGGGASKSF